jgi:hypothetical protein
MVDVASPGTTIDSSPAVSLDTARDAYLENADYAETGSVAKARAFATACRRLLVLLPKKAGHGRGAEEVEFDPLQIRAEREECEKFVKVASASANGQRGTRAASFRSFR